MKHEIDWRKLNSALKDMYGVTSVSADISWGQESVVKVEMTYSGYIKLINDLAANEKIPVHVYVPHDRIEEEMKNVEPISFDDVMGF